MADGSFWSKSHRCCCSHCEVKVMVLLRFMLFSNHGRKLQKENNTKFRTKENYQYIVGMSFRFLLVASYQYIIRSIPIF